MVDCHSLAAIHHATLSIVSGGPCGSDIHACALITRIVLTCLLICRCSNSLTRPTSQPSLVSRPHCPSICVLLAPHGHGLPGQHGALGCQRQRPAVALAALCSSPASLRQHRARLRGGAAAAARRRAQALFGWCAYRDSPLRRRSGTGETVPCSPTVSSTVSSRWVDASRAPPHSGVAMSRARAAGLHAARACAIAGAWVCTGCGNTRRLLPRGRLTRLSRRTA